MPDVPQNSDDAAAAATTTGFGRAAATGLRLGMTPAPSVPLLSAASGLYTWTEQGSQLAAPRPPRPMPLVPPRPTPGPATAAVAPSTAAVYEREELRLDVDGRYPQMAASGTLYDGFLTQTHWIGQLASEGADIWGGPIWYKDGDTAAFPYTEVRIELVRSPFPHQRRATVTFSGGGAASRTQTYRYASAYFHSVEFEFDHEVGAAPATQVDTGAHPTRPPSLPRETVTIEQVFRRAGFEATRSANVDPIPTDGPDTNATWSDAEMHDAMQTYWSRFADRPQWALWVLFARRHDQGSGLGGIMFDEIGPNHRQGTAVFTDSFISEPPAGDPAPDAWIERMRFWTAVHEMGHAFNLAHSWQKHMGTPWLPLTSEPEARSFMNYPYRVAGGQAAFFADFDYSFSDAELLFMRHAPQRFVQMGNADWFDHHGFEGAAFDLSLPFELEIRVDREPGLFEFLEPVVLELELTNVSNEPRIVASDLLLDTEHMVVVIKRHGRPARRWAPFAVHCRRAERRVLMPGESVTESLFVAAGRQGWELAEPGRYTVQMAIEVDGADVVSNALPLRVAPPRGYEEEYLAQDVFTDDAGRVMAFDGSMALESGVAAWRELVERLPNSRAAVHARIALGLPLTRDYRLLRVDAPPDASALGGRGAFGVVRQRPEEARATLARALTADAETAARTLGLVDYAYYAECFAEWLAASGAEQEAGEVSDALQRAVAKLAGRQSAAVRRCPPTIGVAAE